MNHVVIMKATQSDLSTIYELAIELVESVKDVEGVAKDVVYQNCQNALTNPNSYILVTETEGKVIGFISFMTRKTIMHSHPCALIDELVASKRYRRKGVGKELINVAIEECKML